jgi:hypothetical protein
MANENSKNECRQLINQNHNNIREITASIEKKWFSLEFLYREFYIHGYS